MIVPSERIAVLIGEKGSTKKLIEKLAGVKLDIDSESGAVELGQVSDPVRAMRIMDVIRAIGRGFSPERALRLLDDDMLYFDSIDISEVEPSQKGQKRIAGRIIGRKGRTREAIESSTHVVLSVYGKSVSMIGYLDQIRIVKAAIGMLLDGAPHSAVYKFLEKKRSQIERNETERF